MQSLHNLNDVQMSMQARMVLLQRASFDTLATVCASMSADSNDHALVHNCTLALSYYQSTASLVEVGGHHYLVIAAVAAKALLGWLLLSHARRYLRPFDYLVISGGAHCLSLVSDVFHSREAILCYIS